MELEQLSRPLLSLFPETDISDYLTGNTARKQVHAQIVRRLESWMGTQKSERLWIIGSPGPETTSETTIAARHVEAIARAGRLPCVSFFCKRQTINDQQGDSHMSPGEFHSAMLCAMLCSLVRQLIVLLPTEFHDGFDLRSAVSGLCVSPQNIPLALELVRNLLRHAPTLLLVVLDGLQHVADEITQSFVDELVDILRPSDLGEPLRVFKILISSQGFFSSGGRLDVNERLNLSNFLRPRPGKLGGRRSLGAVTVQANSSTTWSSSDVNSTRDALE